VLTHEASQMPNTHKSIRIPIAQKVQKQNLYVSLIGVALKIISKVFGQIPYLKKIRKEVWEKSFEPVLQSQSRSRKERIVSLAGTGAASKFKFFNCALYVPRQNCRKP
jgi:hypothetical protein